MINHVRRHPLPLSLLLGWTGLACSDTGGDFTGPGGGTGNFPVNTGEVCLVEGEPPRSGGVGKDGIPALSNPTMVDSQSPEATYVLEYDRVLGLHYGGEWLAIPFAILRAHEIVNLDWGEKRIAVTYCPLTGSGLAFDRHAVGGAEFGVSGLLWRTNLVMYDRSTGESLWPQMRGRADCGPMTGTLLNQVPISDMTWRAWKGLHPGTRVVSENTGHKRDYTANPYEDYEKSDAPPLSDIVPDRRRPPKERVLGIPTAAGGMAVPFGVLPTTSKAVLYLTVPGGVIAPDGIRVLILWDGEKKATEAFFPGPNWTQQSGVGNPDVVFTVQGGHFVDSATGSYWEVDGRAVEGAAVGSTLKEIQGSMTAFWFAWAAFNPSTDLYLNSG